MNDWYFDVTDEHGTYRYGPYGSQEVAQGRLFRAQDEHAGWRCCSAPYR